MALFAAGCSSNAEDASSDEETSVNQGALTEAATTSALTVACRTLGAVGECDRVTVCQTKTSGSCKATDAARAANPGWESMCTQTGVDHDACGTLSHYCTWEDGTQCVPRAGAQAAGTPDDGPDREVTCKVLGAVNQCGQVSLCKSSQDAQCRAKDAYKDDAFWKPYCSTLSQTSCGYSPQCDWRGVATCTPIDQ